MKRLLIGLKGREKIIDGANLALTAALVIFAGLLAFKLIITPQPDIAALTSSAIAAGSFVEIFSPKPAADYEQSLSVRSLFEADGRANLDSGVSPVIETRDEIGDLRLQGVVSGVKGPQVILFNVKTSQTYYRFVGETINGFKIIKIGSNEAVLEGNGSTVDLRL